MNTLPIGWKSVPLEDCMDAIIDYRGKTPKKSLHGVPLITAKIVKNGRIETPEEFISLEDYESWMTRGYPQEGDVVMTTEAPLGEIAQLDAQKVALAQRIITLRGNEHLDNTYLRFHMQAEFVQAQLLGRASGTTVLGIKQSELRRIQLLLPPLEEQRAIAAILSALDDKIECNRKMNAILEAMAATLFQSWFVEFEPVRDNVVCEDSSPFHALFPLEFQEVEDRQVPKGWRICYIQDLVELAYGKPLKEGERKGGEVAVFGSNGQIGWHDDALVKGPGIVVGRKGNPGTIKWAHSDFYPIDTTFYVVPISKRRILHFLFYLLSAQNLPRLSADSAVPGLNRNSAYKVRVVVPPEEIMETFDLQVEPLFARIAQNNSESRSLAATRDYLLPRLLSGEVRVSEAQIMAAEAVNA